MTKNGRKTHQNGKKDMKNAEKITYLSRRMQQIDKELLQKAHTLDNELSL